MPKVNSTQFTREQRIAQSADRHEAVTAGAGAGKTSVLVQRYINLLFNPSVYANVREIVAITFTRKAAAEMKHRIAEEIEKRLADEDFKPEWTRIKFVRERFSGAKISTIHSYCAQLLREFPIEAGVNPNFTEIEEYDIAILKEQALNETLEAWLEIKPEPKKNKANPTEPALIPTLLPEAEEQDSTQILKPSPLRFAERGLGEGNSENPKALAARRIWTFFGKKNLFEVLTTLLQSAERYNELRVIYDTKSNEELFQATENVFLERMYTLVEEYLVTLENACECLDFNALSKTTRPRFEQLSSSLAILLKQVREAASELALGNLPSQAWARAEEFSSMLITATQGDKTCSRDGKISGTYTKTEAAFLDKELFLRLNDEAKRVFATLGAMQDGMRHHDDDRTILDIARVLMDIASDAWMIVREEKERLGALDFDDLQLKADTLLNNTDVCAKLRLNTRFLMMDEFQDTDELQYRIARKIIGVLGEPIGETLDTALPSTPSTTNLFIVGDPKQSIYRFRGADVRVFAKAKRDIERYNRILLKHNALSTTFATPFGTENAASETEQAGIIGLRATFRLLPEIAAFVNVVAGDQLRRGTTEFDVEYDDIVCGVHTSPVRGSVTMLLPRVKYENESMKYDNEEKMSELEKQNKQTSGVEQENSTDETSVSEARLLAEYIRAAAADDAVEPVMVRSKDGSPRRASFSDVMILVRSRTGTDALLAALRRASVPFVVSAGRGFYERQEILDIRSFLLFLQNTNDDIALAALLRSPFFALTDTELYRISRTEVSVTTEASANALWQRFEAYCTQESFSQITSQPSPDALRAFTTLKNLLPLAAQLSIPSLIRTILEQTSWRAMLAAEERFEQMEANLEKLLAIARRYENKGFRNLYDFAEELRRLAQYAFSEGEADTETGKNAIRIMTIHGAKGLEAPIVALFNANASASHGADGVALSFDNTLGMSFKMFRAREDEGVSDEESGDFTGEFSGAANTVEQYKTPLNIMASKQDEIAEEAELKRLLYVALTRAKDHLVISGKCKQKKDGTMATPSGFLNMIIESLNAEHLNLLNEPYIELPRHSLTLLDGETTREISVEYTMPIIRSLEQLPTYQAKKSSLQANSETNNVVNIAPNTQAISLPELPPMLLGTLNTSVEGDYYSASQLQLFERDPDEYERLYRLGLPPADDEGFITGKASGIEDDSDATLGTSAGECIHAVLEHLPEWCAADGSVMGEAYQRVVERVLPSIKQFIPPDLLARIQRETQAIAATPLVKRFSGQLSGAKYEHQITMPIGSDFLIGALDVLVSAPNGEIEVWDWKTNRVGSARDMDGLLKQYRLQLEVYAFVIAHLAPEQETIRTRLLFTRRATANATDEDWTRVLEFTRLDIQAIEAKILRIAGRIRAQSYGLEMA
jgi:ATP-dependent helicase/nuclease subunit A